MAFGRRSDRTCGNQFPQFPQAIGILSSIDCMAHALAGGIERRHMLSAPSGAAGEFAIFGFVRGLSGGGHLSILCS
jgi:hypothetical protein